MTRRLVLFPLVACLLLCVPSGAQANSQQSFVWKWSTGSTSVTREIPSSALLAPGAATVKILARSGLMDRTIDVLRRNSQTKKFRKYATTRLVDGRANVDLMASCVSDRTCQEVEEFRIVARAQRGFRALTIATLSVRTRDDSALSSFGDVALYIVDDGLTTKVGVIGKVGGIDVDLVVDRRGGTGYPARSPITGKLGGLVVDAAYDLAPKNGVRGSAGAFAIDFWTLPSTGSETSQKFAGSVGDFALSVSQAPAKLLDQPFFGTLGPQTLEYVLENSRRVSVGVPVTGRGTPAIALLVAYEVAVGDFSGNRPR